MTPEKVGPKNVREERIISKHQKARGLHYVPKLDTVELITELEINQHKSVVSDVFMHYLASGDQPEMLTPDEYDRVYSTYLKINELLKLED